MKPNRVDEFIRLFKQMSALELAEAFARIRGERGDLPPDIAVREPVQPRPPRPSHHETMAEPED